MSINLPDEEDSGRWEGYSDYQHVSIRAAQSIDDALDAYAHIRGAHAQNARVSPEVAAEAHGRMMAAVMKVIPEMEQDRETVELYQDVLDEWEGEGGTLNQMATVDLRNECPGWLQTMMIQLRRVGWELGYLQAGKRSAPEPDDPVEAEVKSMFEE